MITAIDLLIALDELGKVSTFEWKWNNKTLSGFHQAAFYVDSEKSKGTIVVSFDRYKPDNSRLFGIAIDRETKLELNDFIQTAWETTFSFVPGKLKSNLTKDVRKLLGKKDPKNVWLYNTAKGVSFDARSARSMLHTIVDICVAFIKKEDPDALVWGATSKRRASIYKRLNALAIKELSASKLYTPVSLPTDDFLIKTSLIKK